MNQGTESHMRFCIFLLFIGLFQASAFYPSSAAGRSDQGRQVKVRGRAVCLDASGRLPEGPIKCEDSSHGFGLIGADGTFYNFLHEDPSAAIFTDPRVRGRELLITARPHPENRLEIIQVQSIHDGKLYDIFYFCEVCNITAYAPGPCTCCRQDFEFRETPARVDKP
jgi:hypothetical protein